MYAERLKKIRNYYKYTVNEIADVLEIKPRTYGSYEREENNVSIELVTSLCKKLNVNANWFVTGEGEMFNKKEPVGLKDEIKQAVREMIASGELKDEFK